VTRGPVLSLGLVTAAFSVFSEPTASMFTARIMKQVETAITRVELPGGYQIISRGQGRLWVILYVPFLLKNLKSERL
jgi:hypothetical protein